MERPGCWVSGPRSELAVPQGAPLAAVNWNKEVNPRGRVGHDLRWISLLGRLVKCHQFMAPVQGDTCESLSQAMSGLQETPLQADPQLLCWCRDVAEEALTWSSGERGAGSRLPTEWGEAP